MKKQALRLLAVGGLLGAVLVPSAAAYADYGGGNTGGQGSGDPGSGGSGNLPFTGGGVGTADVLELSLMGAGLAAGGYALVRTNRRRAAQA